MKKVMLVILDGFGHRIGKKNNAVLQAKMPFYNSLVKKYPNVLIGAHNGYVGLPKGYMGNSEVGHLTLGSGRIIKQDLTKIDDMIRDKSIFKNKVITSFLKKRSKTVHLIGLGSNAGIHGQLNHAVVLTELCFKQGYDVKYHFISDGRDTEPKVAFNYVNQYYNKIAKIKKKYKYDAKIVSVIGRYYAMDRNKNLDRTKKAFDLIYKGKSDYGFIHHNELISLIKKQHKINGDEFLLAIKEKSYFGIEKNDKIFFYNFREDRMRQLVGMIMKVHPHNNILTMSMYDDDFDVNYVLPLHKVKNNLSQILTKNKKKHLHISETEKYAHVTYFFNSGIEKPYPLQRNIIISSPNVKTYDLKPEMSAAKITKQILDQARNFDFVVVNFPNGDMVGHTGNVKATIKGLEFVDHCLKTIFNKYKDEFTFFITADHGNCEEMLGKYKTSHTLNKVRLIITDNDIKLKAFKNKGLSNIAASILKYMKLKVPEAMDDALF